MINSCQLPLQLTALVFYFYDVCLKEQRWHLVFVLPHQEHFLELYLFEVSDENVFFSH